MNPTINRKKYCWLIGLRIEGRILEDDFMVTGNKNLNRTINQAK